MKVNENGCKAKSKQTVYILCLWIWKLKELERVEMVEDAQNKEVSNVTPEKENTMAKEKV